MPLKDKEKRKEYDKQYYQRNQEKIKKRNRQYHKNNPEYTKQYYQENKEYFKEYKKRQKIENPEYEKQRYQKRKEYCKKYRQENKKYLKEYDKKYHRSNQKHFKKLYNQWTKTEKGKAHAQRSLSKRRAKEKDIVNTLTSQEWLNILEEYNYKCAYCGCEFDENNLPTRDHIIPISKGGNNIKENIIPACQSCNSKKGNKIIKNKEKELIGNFC